MFTALAIHNFKHLNSYLQPHNHCPLPETNPLKYNNPPVLSEVLRAGGLQNLDLLGPPSRMEETAYLAHLFMSLPTVQ